MTFYTKLKLFYWKRRARINYIRYNDISDTFSCGCALAEVISSDMYNAKIKFNEAMDKLTELNPLTPPDRL